MSDNMASMRHNRKTPFRNDNQSMLNEVLDQSEFHVKPTLSSDFKLMSDMIGKITELENCVRKQARDIIEKDKLIRELKKHSATSSNVCTKCPSLVKQIQSMEAFLADYGLIWIGDDVSDDVYEETDESTWKPEMSVVNSEQDTINFDLVIKHLSDLSDLANTSVIEYSKSGATLKHSRENAVPIVLYKNGLVLFAGPFRPYTEATTRRCIRDIVDGYFPSELQRRYPDGTAFSITDKRDVTFTGDAVRKSVFAGSGNMLGANSVECTQSTQTNAEVVAGPVETSLPGQKLSLDQFLGKLPTSTITAQGNVFDVRAGIGEIMRASDLAPDTQIIETDVVRELKSRLSMTDTPRPATPRQNLTTLRVKSECGNTTFVLKLRASATVTELRRYIDSHRSEEPSGVHPYDIVSGLTNTVLSDGMQTLSEYGLVPNATLRLRRSS